MTDKTGLTDDSGPSAHMNSFLKERLSVLPNISDVQRCTDAIGLSSRRSTCIEITIVTDKQSDEGFPSFLQLPTVIKESKDDLGLEDLSDLEKTSP
ncbi:hypothetical protein VKT23_004386 [Stygiomarasmius scandens]|uniref:Uncharacterized protein n=1 Tax=Marasmiellus scandens TaxID=2682957 RepID=A0ABR1JZS2_9AGAR